MASNRFAACIRLKPDSNPEQAVMNANKLAMGLFKRIELERASNRPGNIEFLALAVKDVKGIGRAITAELILTDDNIIAMSDATFIFDESGKPSLVKDDEYAPLPPML